MQYRQLMFAAKEIAAKHIPESEWDMVTYKYGVFIDAMTDDEYDELERLVKEYWR